MSEEFFIGWQGKAPEKMGKFLKGLTIAVVLAAVGVAAVLPALQKTVSQEARYDFGNQTEFSGVLVGEPVPMLVGDDDAVYLLVNPFKHGFARELAAEHHLRRVRLKGTRIHRGNHEMIEVLPETVMAIGDAKVATHPLGSISELGETTLKGEIVDSKCYLGVMNPGSLKTHRACAINCIEGGIPPVLLVRDQHGRATYVLLVDAEGGSVNAGILGLVAEPVSVTGRLKKLGEQLILFADPVRFSRE